MLNLFGYGFIGSEYASKYPCIVNDRNDITIKSSEILYFISTVHNYHVFDDPYIDIETNLITLIRVLEQCKDKDVTFNFISSWFVYGDTEYPAKEDSYCSPKGFYSITKRTAEQLLISYCETFNIKYRILRLANVIGKSDSKVSKKKNALQYLIGELKLGNDISLYDNGEFIRDYIDVSDVCDAIRLIVTKGEINTIYNIGNEKPVLFKDIIEYARLKLNSQSQIINIEQTCLHKTVQVKSMWMNCEKIKKLGYAPKHDIYKSIDQLL